MQPLNYKRIGMIVAVAASSTLLWAVSRTWLDSPGRFTDVVTMLWPALAFVVAGAVTAVAFLLMEHFWDRLAAMVTSWATFIFFWPANIWYVSALAVFFALWFIASRDIHHDLTDRRTVRVAVSLRQGMKLILLGMFWMVSLGFYLLPSSQNTSIAAIGKSAQSSVENVYHNPVIQAELSQLPAGAQAQVRAQVGQYVSETVTNTLTPIKEYIPPILAFGLFLSLWSINFLLRPPAVWLGERLVWLLRRLGFVRVQETQVKAEVLSI